MKTEVCINEADVITTIVRVFITIPMLDELRDRMDLEDTRELNIAEDEQTFV